MASTLLTILCQKVSRSGAPGRTHAIPMIATSPRTAMSLKCPCPSGDHALTSTRGCPSCVLSGSRLYCTRLPHLRPALQLSSVSIERNVTMHNVAGGIRFDPHLTIDPLSREGSESFIGLHTGGQGCHILHPGPDDDQLQRTVQNDRVDNPGALCLAADTSPGRRASGRLQCR